MAAEIRPFPSSSSFSGQDAFSPGYTTIRPDLISKLDGHTDVVNAAVLLQSEDGVISISDDKTVRIWLKRDTGNYWPSVCHIMPAQATSLEYNSQTFRLFVGMENGHISEFRLSDDFNRMTNERNYIAHQARVTGLVHSPSDEWILSVGRDKYFQWHCTETGRRLGCVLGAAWCTALQFDTPTKHVFIGDYNGMITMLKIEESGYKPITTLRGHQAQIRCLAWDPERSILFSGAADNVIICWDIGGKKGTAYELQGHRNKVTSLVWDKTSHTLFSGAEDSHIVAWNMKERRQETPSWVESDTCQRCNRPFFWNLRAQYEQKTIGLRQHHCRRCGKAMCDNCSAHRSTLPIMGFEFKVRICDECSPQITESDRLSLAKFIDTKHHITCMHYDAPRRVMLTCGSDRIIKLWDMAALFGTP